MNCPKGARETTLGCVVSLLAMTVVGVTRLCRFKLNAKLNYESFRMENPRLANANRGIVLQRAV